MGWNDWREMVETGMGKKEMIEIQGRKSAYRPSKGQWTRAIDNRGTGRRCWDRASQEIGFQLISLGLMVSGKKKDIEAHTLDWTDSTSL